MHHMNWQMPRTAFQKQRGFQHNFSDPQHTDTINIQWACVLDSKQGHVFRGENLKKTLELVEGLSSLSIIICS